MALWAYAAEPAVVSIVLADDAHVDVFDAAFAKRARTRVASLAEAFADAKAVQFTLRPLDAWVQEIRTLPGSATGKQLYIHFLKEKYGYNVARVNEAYGTEASSFTELESATFERLDRTRAAVAADDREFAHRIVESFLKAVDPLPRELLPRAKVWSPPMPFDTPPELWRLLARHADVLCVATQEPAELKKVEAQYGKLAVPAPRP